METTMNWATHFTPHLSAKAPGTATAVAVLIIIGILLLILLVVGTMFLVGWARRLDRKVVRTVASGSLRILQRAADRLRWSFVAIALLLGPICLWSSYDDQAERELCLALLMGFALPICLGASYAASSLRTFVEKAESEGGG